MDVQDIVKAVVAAEGYIPLAIEKLKVKFPDERINEYDVKEAITSDAAATKTLSEQFRGLLILKTFDTLKSVQDIMIGRIDEMKAGDVSRLYAALMSIFSQMTAPAVKDTFDFEAEVVKTSALLGIPEEEVRADLKMLRASKAEAAKSNS